ncbi:MAG: hypothetical protein SGARI_000579 [Bacillariaceae sp.]
MNESAATGPNSLSKKLLQNMGWKEGTGLGKDGKGRKSHIKVQKRVDGVGLGNSSVEIDPVVTGEQWWKNSVGNTLAKLSSSKKKKKDKKKSKQEKSKSKKLHYTDDELFQATGGARFGMRAQTQQHGKWQRAESGISVEEEANAQSNLEWDGMTAPKVVLSDDKTKKKKKRKRDADVSSSDDSEAAAPPPAEVVTTDDYKVSSSSTTTESDDDDDKSKKKKKSSKKQKTEDDDDNAPAEKSTKKKDKKKKKSQKKSKKKSE